MRAVSRWIFLIHRYGGLGLSLLMLMWCLTGIVMRYVPYPSLRESERIAGLPPIDWQRVPLTRAGHSTVGNQSPNQGFPYILGI